MGRVQWKPVEKGIYTRDYGAEKAYQLQAMAGGRRFTDTLGVVSLEDARIIRDTLARNRKIGAGPQTWAEMQGEAKEKAVAEKLVQEQERKEVLREELKRRDNTVARFWENRFWPRRLSLRRSARETASMDGRWRNYLKGFFGDIPLADLNKAHFLAFVSRQREAGLIGETTIHKCITDLRQMWALAIEEDVVDRLFPGKSVVREVAGEIDNEKKCWLTHSEANLLVRTVWERRLKGRLDHDVCCYVILGLGLGLRAGDIHKLNRQIVESQIIPRTKNKRSRYANFSFEPVRVILQERLDLYPPADALEPLFCSQQGASKGKMRTEVPGKYFEIIKELGFNETPARVGNPLLHIDFHALRHTFASLAAMNGVDHVTLARLMGYKKLDMTLRYIELADAYKAENQQKAVGGIFPEELVKRTAELDKIVKMECKADASKSVTNV